MRHDMTEAEYIESLAQRAQEPDIQALVQAWGTPGPEQLALVARVFGAAPSAPSTTASGEAA